MNIFWHPTGPLVEFKDGFLHISDLNPEIKTKWRMSRWEMFVFGLRSIVAAARAQ